MSERPLPNTPWQNEEDKVDRFLNSFATESFRDQADRDYIAARLACRYELFPQFLWSSQQAIEKYLKAILLYNRIKAVRVRHDIRKALELTKGMSFKIQLSSRCQRFFDLVADYGEFRYLDIPFQVAGHVMLDLDLTIWEIRRYCQVLDVFGKVLSSEEQVLLDQALKRLEKSDSEPRHKFRLHNGLLEKIIANRTHPSREALLWQNPCFTSRKRTFVLVHDHLNAQNPYLTHYPEMLDELLKYVFISPRVVDAYRAHAICLSSEDGNPEA